MPSRDRQQTPPSSGSSHPSGEDEEDYGPYPTSTYPHYSSVRSFPTPHPHHPAMEAETGSSVTQTTPSTAQSDLPITRLERWAVRASPSQFNALAGAIGGFTSGVVTCPLDVIKTKLQAQGGFQAISKGRHVAHPKMYKGLLGTGGTIWKEEGLRGMYRGLGPIVLGYLPTWAVWFTVYNKSKEVIRPYQENTFIVSLYSSIIAGASSTIVTNPIWVIKTRLMSQSVAHRAEPSYAQFPKTGSTPTTRPTLQTPWHYKSTIDAARKMYTTEGLLSFYSGLTPALLGLTHVAVQFPAYEFLKTRFTGQGMGASMDKENSSSHWLGVLSASIFSKILASSVTYPHEVIRTRLQTQRRPVAGASQGAGGAGGKATEALIPKYKGVLATFRTILFEEGWRAFYAGMGTNMMRAVPAATVTMLTYEFIMEEFNLARAEGRRKLGITEEEEGA